jgi:hypothetical protein
MVIMRIAPFRFVLLIAVLAGSVLGQNRADSSIPFAFSTEPTNCETNGVRLDSYAKYFVKAVRSDGGVIIAIARLGTGERSSDLNRSRLYIVRATLIEDLKLREQDIVTAQGTPVNGYGRVEIYMRGKLMDVLLVKRGKALCADCCHPEGRKYSYPVEKRKS